MWVVKFGGSLFSAANLKKWLTLFANAASMVIVPGGGPFADQVRAAQAQFAFDDETAHRMALLAMEQYARMLCALQPGLTLVSSQIEIDAALAEKTTPVWTPVPMAVGDPDIEQSWDVTSDSLAVWLAGKLGINRLVLVKSIAFDHKQLCREMLEEHDVVDERFTEYLEKYRVDAWMVGRDEHSCFSSLINGQFENATRITI